MINQSSCKILMMKDPETSNGTIVAISPLRQITPEMLSAMENGVQLSATKVNTKCAISES